MSKAFRGPRQQRYAPAVSESPQPSSASNLALHAASQVAEVVRGKEETARLALIAVLAQGHILLEDVPGVGKTTLARALARVIGGDFSRIQLTADLLPVDIVGGQVLDSGSGQLSFRKGPVFASVVLADELNRATPRTQSGLLEAMAERAVSVDGTTHRLPEPFFVIATQNPNEHHGTYALPQSQMDRFLFRTAMGYPDQSIEHDLLVGRSQDQKGPEALEVALEVDVLRSLWGAVDAIQFAPEVANYLQSIVQATRGRSEIETGVSTRGLIMYGQAVRARALLEGRSYVSPDDVHALAIPICAHRLVLRGTGGSRAEAESVMAGLVASVSPPA